MALRDIREGEDEWKHLVSLVADAGACLKEKTGDEAKGGVVAMVCERM